MEVCGQTGYRTQDLWLTSMYPTYGPAELLQRYVKVLCNLSATVIIIWFVGEGNFNILGLFLSLSSDDFCDCRRT